MRIGLIVPGFSAEPADWCIPALRHLVRALAAHDDVRVVAIRYPYRAARYTIDGAETIALGGAISHGAATLNLWRTTLEVLRREHRRRPFDVLHAFWATESGLLAALAGRLLRVPTLVSLAGGELVALRDIHYGDQRIAWERYKVAASLRLATSVSAGSRQLVALASLHLKHPPYRHQPTRRDLLSVDPNLSIPSTRPTRGDRPRGDLNLSTSSSQTARLAPLGVDLNLFTPPPQTAHHVPLGVDPNLPAPSPRPAHQATSGVDPNRTTPAPRPAHQVTSGVDLNLPSPSRQTAHLAPLGVDLSLFTPPPRDAATSARETVSRRNGPHLVHVGALTPVKDHDTLLYALASLRQQGQPATLDVVGDGPLRPRLEHLARDLDVASSVRFRGEIDHADLPASYTSADAIVVSSRHEAQCMAALEAAACGVPVVGTCVGVIPELTSAVAPVRDPESLARAITRALAAQRDARDPTLDHVRSTFGVETCADRFRAVYATLVES